ncbi:P-loop containing nucleoside triphosphate hydrolase protein [Mycena amicta]|nr:P-loop containing nucleoside triphosphate hydrolase protein [Mycena amicta]
MQRLWAACRPQTKLFGVRFRSVTRHKPSPQPREFKRKPQTPHIPDAPHFASPADTLTYFRQEANKWSRKSAPRERLVTFGTPLADANGLLDAFARDVQAGFFDPPARMSEYPMHKLNGANYSEADIVMSHIFFQWLKERGSALGFVQPTTIPSLLRLSEAASNLFPAEIFERARRMRRKIIMHVGPTNSGKTHHALRALAAAKSGVYAGPLRLLAHEIWERLNLGQVAPLGATEDQIAAAAKIGPSIDNPFARECNMLTGEEIKIVEEGAPLSSCTVEMLSLTIHRDVAVVDEIQMITDPQRGNAWTRAVLGLCADELHLCGEDTAVPLIQQIAKETGDELIIRRYERLTPLNVEKESLDGDLSRVQKGDCIVTFSRSSIFATKSLVERETPMKCAVVYGRLPPEIRSQQAALFNAGNTDYDILIGSDAIGMGLNLKIRRIIFQAVAKFDGDRETLLSVSQMKQIAGRAGRFGMHESGEAPGGFVTTLREADLPVLQRTLPKANTPARHARISSTQAGLQGIVAYLPENASTETLFTAYIYAGSFGPHYLPAVVNHLPTISEFLDTQQFTLSDRLLMLDAPFPWRDKMAMNTIAQILHQYYKDAHIDLEACMRDLGYNDKLLDAEHGMKHGTTRSGKSFRPSQELQGLEMFHKILVLYIWLGFRNPVACAAFDLAQEWKGRVEQALHWCLEEMTYESGGRRAAADAKVKPVIPYAHRRSRRLAAEVAEAAREERLLRKK